MEKIKAISTRRKGVPTIMDNPLMAFNAEVSPPPVAMKNIPRKPMITPQSVLIAIVGLVSPWAICIETK
jgi:hypothetical protein